LWTRVSDMAGVPFLLLVELGGFLVGYLWLDCLPHR
jgi:hypothetical protein